MKVVILAGGFGTRIRDVSEDIPKPMIEIGSVPILLHIMKYFSYFNYKEFIICLGYKGNIIRDYFINYRLYTENLTIDFSNNDQILFNKKKSDIDWKVTMVNTGINSMTGARINKIKDYVGKEDFFITYGDGVGDINLNELLNLHNSKKKILTVTGVRPPGRFGELRSSNGIISEFNEKPQTTEGRISGGFFVAKSQIFNYLNNDEGLVFEKEPIKKLVTEKQLAVFNHDGFWHPMDTSREFQILNDLYNQKKAPWVKWKY